MGTTHVVTIEELYKLIPQTKKLEGVNFSTMKQLLVSVIEAVEKNQSWEFVQYVQGKPSLFVVRTVENNRNIVLDFPTSQPMKTTPELPKTEIIPTTENVQKPVKNDDKQATNNSSLFVSKDLPW